VLIDLFENHHRTHEEKKMLNLPTRPAVPAPEDDDLVPNGCECPHCGENRIDYLVLDEEDWVTCETCGTEYPV
jgi:hypothetical protein